MEQKPKVLVGFPRRRTHPKTRESLCVQMISCGRWDQTAHKGVAKYPKSWCLVGKGLVCAPPTRGPCPGERGEGWVLSEGADVAGGLIKTSATSGGDVSRHCQRVPSSAKGPWVCHIRLRKQNRCASFPGLCVLPEGCFCCVVPAVSCIKVCHGQPAQRAEHCSMKTWVTAVYQSVPRLRVTSLRLCCVVLEMFLFNIHIFGQMFQADRCYEYARGAGCPLLAGWDL